MKSLFIPCFSKGNFPISKLKIPHSKLGLFATIQHLPQLEQLKKILEKKGKKVILEGQILGCDSEKIKKLKNKVDAFLYLGSGKFHPLEIAIHSKKPVFVLNPYSGSLKKISEKEIREYESRRKGALAKALEAKTLGILISTKTGQCHLARAKKLKEKLEKKGKKVFLFAGDEITPERLLGFKVDGWINTACPRIIEDYFDKSILNPEEINSFL